MVGLLDGFEKICAVRGKGCTEKLVSIKGSGKYASYLRISTAALEEAGITYKDKVDLYCSNGTFALKKSIAGMYSIKRESNTFSRINSTAMCREIRIRAGETTDFTAWGIAEAGVLFFKAKENE